MLLEVTIEGGWLAEIQTIGYFVTHKIGVS